MKSPLDPRLEDEMRRFALRWSCDDCAHFAPEEDRCAHGYPTAPHRASTVAGSHLIFCKEFELGSC